MTVGRVLKQLKVLLETYFLELLYLRHKAFLGSNFQSRKTAQPSQRWKKTEKKSPNGLQQQEALHYSALVVVLVACNG